MAAGVLLIWYCEMRPKKTGRQQLFSAVSPFLCIFLLFLSGAGGWLLSFRMLQKEKSWEALRDRPAVLYGEAEPDTIRVKQGGIAFLFHSERPLQGKVRIFIKTGDTTVSSSFGEESSFTGRMPAGQKGVPDKRRPGYKQSGLALRRLTQGKLQISGTFRENVFLQNPGTYNGYLSARVKNITGTMLLEPGQIEITQEPLSRYGTLAAWSQNLRMRAQALCRTSGGVLLISMILGGYQGVDAEEADVFRDNGLAHLLAVSGAHVALLIAFLSVFLRFLPPAARFCGILFFLWLYAVLCGLQPAVIRASAMASVLLWGRRGGIRADTMSLLLLTAWGMLCWDPFWLLDISFQLSFVTVAGLLLAGEKVTAFTPERWPEPLRRGIGISLTAQLAVLPFVVFYFHRLSLVSTVSNLVLLPALSVAAACFLPGLLCIFILPELSRCLFLPAERLLEGALALGGILRKLPFAVVDVADWGLLRSISYWGFLAGFLDLPVFTVLSGKQRRLWLGLTGSLFLLVWGMQIFWPRPLTVHFIDVGQGDAALIQTPAGKNLLIDTGGLQGEQEVGRSVIVPYLRCLGVKQLDALCLSHGDHDHAGGAAFTAGAIPVRTVFLGANAEASEDVRRLLEILPQDSEIRYVKTGEQWQVGDCRVAVASAAGGEDMNSSSLILQLFCRGHSLVFPGDADQDTELEAVPYLEKAEVLKVGHHGSRTSSAPAFLQKLRPRLAVISAGKKNRYGHPHAEVLENLASAGCTILRTDRLGALKVILDAKGVHWYSYAFQKYKF